MVLLPAGVLATSERRHRAIVIQNLNDFVPALERIYDKGTWKHAQSVTQTAYMLLALILQYRDRNSDVRVREYKGIITPSVNFTKSNVNYTLGYSGDKKQVMLKKGLKVLHWFDDSTPPSMIRDVFRNL